MNFDVIVVGGGIVGCSTALYLAKRGVKVGLFERGRVASEQSGRAWGFIRRQGRHPAEIPLAEKALRLWSELAERHGAERFHFSRGGVLAIAETQNDQHKLEEDCTAARRLGLPTELVSTADIRKLIPELVGNWRIGLLTTGDSHADPALATATIAEAARNYGVVIHDNESVQKLSNKADLVTGVVTARGNYTGATVVLAGGIGASRLARQVGINLPILAIRSSVGRTTPAQRFTDVAVWAPQTAYRPSRTGQFTIGTGYRGFGVDFDITLDVLRNMRLFWSAYKMNRNWHSVKFNINEEFFRQFYTIRKARPLPEPRINQIKVETNFAQFKRILPHLQHLTLEQSWAGRIDLTPDIIPIIDMPLGNSSLLVAAGFSGHGFALGPAVGHEFAEWIIEGHPQMNFDPFKLSRFTR